MPRRPRIALAGVPVHIIQRDNNCGACFFADEDYRYYLDRQLAEKCGCAVHAYVLMTDHVHLLLIPEKADSASLVLKHLDSVMCSTSIGPIDVAARSGRVVTGPAWRGKSTS